MLLFVSGSRTGKQKKLTEEDIKMNIKINGKQKEIEKDGLVVSEILALEDVKNPDMVAVQFNGVFLKKEHYNTTPVKEGDEVEFLYFMGGGERRK